MARNAWNRARLRHADDAYRRSKFLPLVIAGMAALAMLMTISSMGSRWINEYRARWRDRSIGIIPPVVALSTLAEAIRPIRIDANQLRSRLGIDLAVFERAKATLPRVPGAGGFSDMTPKAA